MGKKKIAIIGSGFGGLSASIHLAVSGYDVSVYEKNSFPGGKAHAVVSEEFTFDAGPSLLTMPHVLEDIFKFAGEDMDEYLPLQKLEIICKYFYKDGSIIKAYSDLDKFALEIADVTADTYDSVQRYFRHCKEIYELVGPSFLYKDFLDPKNIFNLDSLKTLLQINKIEPHLTLHKSINQFFKDNRVIQLFDRYATYNGSDPFRAPAVLNIIPHVEYTPGAFIPKGGIRKIPEALYKLAEKKGVKFFFNSNVDKILTKDGRAAGIIAGGKSVYYDAVISNADVNYTYKKLLGSKEHANKKTQEPSSSAAVFYWGVEGTHDDLEIHNILFSHDYKEEFNDIFTRKTCPADPTVYIYVSSKYNPNDAPAGCENWFVMVNAPYNAGQNWDEEIKTVRNNTIKKINKFLGMDLESLIKTEKVLMPPDMERLTNSQYGSIYGDSFNSKWSAFKRHGARSKKYKNLYFAGGTVHPGGGIPLTLLSGVIAAKSLMNGIYD